MFQCDDSTASEKNPRNFRGWVDQPNYRGTFDIILSCLFVLLTCTWAVLHVNLPAQTDTFLTTWLRKFRWAVLAVFAPEIVTLFAACQWSSARSSVRSMHELGASHWTIVHGFYADSGGFILHTPDMPPFPVDTRALQYLIENRYLEVPEIKKDDIQDRSKTDKFAKTVAVVQSGWMIAQCIGRLVQSLDTTPLELVTVAFTVCTVASYFSWMEKPLDIEGHSNLTITTTTSEILRNAGPAARQPYVDTPMDFVGGCGVQQGPGAWGRRQYFKSFGGPRSRPLQRIPDDYTPPPRTVRLAFSQWAISMIHGAIHVAGWKYPFPTLAEQYLWRSGSAALLAIVILWGIVEILAVSPGLNFTIILLGIWEKTTTSKSLWRRWALDLPATLCAVLYIIARITLLVQAVVILRSMPCSVYKTVNWTNFIPHV